MKNIFGLGSENTAKNYLAYLNEAYLMVCLPKFSFKKQFEVDFVIYSNRKVIELIQVAQSTTDSKTLKREIKALLIAAAELKAEKLTIITLNERKELIEEGRTIRIVPVTELLLNDVM